MRGGRGVRGKRKNRKVVTKHLRLLGVNTAGINSKFQSFKKVLHDLQPSLFFLEETKCKAEGTIKIRDYIIFEKIRQNQLNGGGGGGIALGVKSELHPVFIRDGGEYRKVTCYDKEPVLCIK